ncbi:MAG TPA: tetratricopeptide repeat protein [Gemmatimonadaceae bacterium]|nr:tetratricopeptide repeat protein [Gemmatimonadaceae bacterium]
MPRALKLASAVFLLCAAPLVAALPAQSRAEKIPKRPSLPAGSDTNSGFSYYMYAKAQIRKNPARAADALYWASRMQPGVAELLYGRRIALLLSDKPRLVRYFFGDLDRDPQIQRIDSLQYWALLRNPFLDQAYDGMLLEEMYFELTGEQLPLITPGGDPRMAAWNAQRLGNFPAAAERYAQAIKRYPKQHSLRGERARVLYQLGQFDSAVVELTRMRDALQKEDAKAVRVYDSKAMIEYRIGRIHARTGNLAVAREAYGRALSEDLSFYMGHVALADLSLATGDTATALSELELAVQLRGDDGELRQRLGVMLVSAGRLDEAVTQLREAVKLEPYFARSYLYLARILEHQQNTDAIGYYKSFIQLAEAADPQLPSAKTQLADLEAWAATVKSNASQTPSPETPAKP